MTGVHAKFMNCIAELKMPELTWFLCTREKVNRQHKNYKEISLLTPLGEMHGTRVIKIVMGKTK